ncbi:MAG TPA: hypothetical protein VFU32_00520 [Ktedonobacterales bacterium]|nr:hypothetical protein [Ktedonobacterales bacterium]
MSIDRQEPLRILATAVARIQGTGGTGRLALRNTVRMGTLHLYFELGRLVHLEGSRSNIDDCLIDLAGWTDGLIRLDIGVQTERHTVTPEQETFFNQTLLLMQQRGVVNIPSRPMSRFPAAPPPAGPPIKDVPPISGPIPRNGPRPHLPERTPPRMPVMHGPPHLKPGISGPLPEAPPTPEEVRRMSHPPERAYSGPLPSAPPAPGYAGRKQPVPPAHTADILLSNRQWETLVDAMYAMLEGVGHLFGMRQAQNILQHVLAERSKQSEPLSMLQVDRQGRLHELRIGEMLNQPVEEVSEAFVLLISDFERQCAALLGPERARQIIARTLHHYQDGLAEIGIALNA